MKRKITYILKDLDKLFIKILQSSGDFYSQVNLMKQKEELIAEIDKIIEKYKKIINEK